ncbi:GAF and ANTAR domain-containing protein [Cellulomonas dongxiuzhuiae]|uniref:GAF and ANTAR domain-containing protein n=1 Tax=Cellulomonas dongxiuzhuiae TaxID=2819979 RepID=UPI001AAEF939|nr:GAF and ANTAR domain-containing protein [Cellulomonas dongxiuzhuiae]MBO3087257.1 GAF and ANTAR domain-containing protein [Cellulomonas dongxiuzhuiae]
MTAGSSLEHVVARASGLMLAGRTVDGVLRLLTSTAVQAVPSAYGAGITLVGDDGVSATTAGTDRLVEAADGLQYELAEGPCLTAWLTRRVVRVDDAAAETRWPRWASAVVDLGLHSVLSAPVVAGDAAFGAIKLYSRDAGAFTDHDETTLGLFAAQTALLVAGARSSRQAGRLGGDVQALLARRDALQQAIGLLMGRDRVTEQAALGHLASVAERERLSVHDIASRALTEHARRVVVRP